MRFGLFGEHPRQARAAPFGNSQAEGQARRGAGPRVEMNEDVRENHGRFLKNRAYGSRRPSSACRRTIVEAAKRINEWPVRSRAHDDLPRPGPSPQHFSGVARLESGVLESAPEEAMAKRASIQVDLRPEDQASPGQDVAGANGRDR